VAEFRAATPEQEAFLDEVLAAGLLIPSGVPGVYGRSAELEGIRLAVDAAVNRAAEPDGAELLRFPPLVPRDQFESTGYLKSFPHLAGTIFGFEGSEAQAQEQEERASRHEDWSEHQQMSDLVLVPAACYPVYPAIAKREPLAAGGITVDAGGAYVFRNEPSGDPARLQMFHQREIVRIGEPETVASWRDTWRDRAIELLRGLGLDANFDVASDPFFGRSGRLMAASQREQALKFEILVPIGGPEPTAVASFNYHQRHFAETFGIEMADGTEAHTSCLGFGLERISLALVKAHGTDSSKWPGEVREELWGK
jgi:seryl-tRNA synthetase